MTEEEKAFLAALVENLNGNLLAIRRLNDALQGLALAVERLAFPERATYFKDGILVTDLGLDRPGGIFPLACRALVASPDGSGPRPCGRPGDDAIHDAPEGHQFTA